MPRKPRPEPIPAPSQGLPDAGSPNLIVAFQRGDRAAFDQLWALYAGPVFNFILRQVGSPDDAQELAQDTWLKIVRGASNYTPKAKMLTWILQVARNTVLDHFKKQRLRNHDSLDVAASADGTTTTRGDTLPDHLAIASIDAVAAAEDLDRLRLAVQRLTGNKREALVLRMFHDLPYEEIAKILGAPEGTAKYWVHEAIKDLNKLLTQPANL